MSSLQKNIDLSGGEPFLYFGALKRILEHARLRIPDSNITVTTNGTLINNKQVAFLKANHIDLKISIDGEEKTHDLNRRLRTASRAPAYRHLLRTIKMLSGNNVVLKAVMVFGPRTVANLYDNLRHLIKLGFTHIDFYPEIFAFWQNHQLKLMDKQFVRVTALFAESLQENKLPFSNSLLFSLLNETGVYKHSRCNQVSVDPGGNFYCCDKVFSLSRSKRQNYQLGPSEIGIDGYSLGGILDVVRKKIKNTAKYKDCKSCEYLKYCFCPIGLYLYTRNNGLNINSYLDNFCRVSKIYIKNFLDIKSEILDSGVIPSRL